MINMTVIVDYGMGNLDSVVKAAAFLRRPVRVSSACAAIKKADKIVLPGVGHFGEAVAELTKRKLYRLLQDRIAEGIPFLGICVGMQLLFESSAEAPGVRGLGVIEGTVEKFSGARLIVPHMGWNQVEIAREPLRKNSKGKKSIFEGIPDAAYFYFAHSYYCRPVHAHHTAAITRYGTKFASAVCCDAVWGVQFHPEKSQKYGLRVFDNFLKS